MQVPSQEYETLQILLHDATWSLVVACELAGLEINLIVRAPPMPPTPYINIRQHIVVYFFIVRYFSDFLVFIWTKTYLNI